MTTSTKFITHRLEIDGASPLWIDGNSKVCLDRPFDEPHANCFSLVSVDDCPGATKACISCCYTKGLAEYSPDTFKKYAHNSRVMRALLTGPGQRMKYWRTVQALAEYASTNCATGFRWHVSGDIFSARYAQFIADVTRTAASPFWIYTRSFQWVDRFIGLGNLVVNLSADRDNLAAAREAQAGTDFRICYMSLEGEVPDLPPGSVIFPNYPLRGGDLERPSAAPWWQGLTMDQRRMVCPPDFFGQSERVRCGPCRKCLDQPAELVQLR